MAAFDYVALDGEGRKRKGVIEADSARQTRQILRERALTPIRIDEASQTKKTVHAPKSFRVQKIGLREISVLTRQLAVLVQAGLPVEQALQALSQQSERPQARSMLAAVRSQVLEGRTLAESLGAFPNSFSELFRSSVHAGERSGHLGKVLEHLADFSENSYQSRQRVLLALLYPMILTVVSVLIIFFLMVFIIPDMVKVFSSSEHALPWLTQALMFISGGLQEYGLVLLVLVAGGAVAAAKALRRPDMRMRVDQAMLRVPLLGKIAYQYNAARFASTLGMLQDSGVPLAQALDISAAVVPNQHVRLRVAEVSKQVREGVSLSKAMEQSGVFAPVLLTMVGSGEASGTLGAMLTRAGVIGQRDLENRIAVYLGLFEPMVLLVMGGLVLLLVLAIILPILNLNQLVQ